MPTRKTPPLLRVEPLSGEIAIITRYTKRPNNTIYASERFFVPDDEFAALVKQWRAHKRRERRRRAQDDQT